MTPATSYFSPDYATARRRFRDAVDRLNWPRESHLIPGQGPNGEDLTIDVAVSAPARETPAPIRTLILSSGLHGVEGFFGSAVQLAFLEQRATDLSEMRCVLIHGLNPHGFAWNRRFDADNIDPNRNFLLPGEPFSGCPEKYPHFNSFLNPQSPPANWEFFYLHALRYILRYGMPALRQAIAAGQYEYPAGLFFGGHGPSQTQLVLNEHMRHWIGHSHHATHLDFHTGLGRWGTCKLLMDSKLTPKRRDQLTRWFGENSFEESQSTTIAYQTRGGWGPWCEQLNLATNYIYACAEFGTYSPVEMLAGLRAENRAHHWSRRDAPEREQTRQHLRELFCPASPQWQQAVVDRSIQFIDQARNGLLSEQLYG